MKINFKKLSDTAITPRKANYNDAGFDLYADEDVTLTYGETKAIATTGPATSSIAFAVAALGLKPL